MYMEETKSEMVVTYCRLGLYIDPIQVAERLPADQEKALRYENGIQTINA